MGLPKKLETLIGTITPQTNIERELLRVLTKRLRNSLDTLESGLGCANKYYDRAIRCVFKEKTTTCLDEFEASLEKCIFDTLRRAPTEAEEELLGELIGHVTGITEVLLTMGGIELIDADDDEDEEDGVPMRMPPAAPPQQ